jgi:hypothetical protein
MSMIDVGRGTKMRVLSGKRSADKGKDGIDLSFLTFFLCCLLALSSFPNLLAPAQASSVELGFSGPTDERGIPEPWRFKLNTNDDGAHAAIVSNDGESVLHMKSANSSFALERKVQVDVREYPRLEWTWKALLLPSEGDIRDGDRNDQALQVLVAFEDGRVLSYVWDTNAPRGTVAREHYPWPISLDIRAIVVNSFDSDIGAWLTVSRNVYEDHKKLFQGEPRQVKGVRLQMNTQHTGGNADGFVRKIVFSKNPLTSWIYPINSRILK